MALQLEVRLAEPGFSVTVLSRRYHAPFKFKFELFIQVLVKKQIENLNIMMMKCILI